MTDAHRATDERVLESLRFMESQSGHHWREARDAIAMIERLRGALERIADEGSDKGADMQAAARWALGREE